MGRSVNVENLVGVQDIAAKLGVERTTVHKWRVRHDFPDPVAALGGEGQAGRKFLVWDWTDVEVWARTNGYPRNADRPPS